MDHPNEIRSVIMIRKWQTLYISLFSIIISNWKQLHLVNSFITPLHRINSLAPFASTKITSLDPDSIYGPCGEDLVWEALRKDAFEEAGKEPLLASFMHASILSHFSLEKSLAFHMANLLTSPAMISTQIQALFLEALNSSPSFRISLRLDILAVMIRDPAVKSYTDVLLYFKGFQALQTHRVAHWLWSTDRSTLALFLHSRANTVFHIDIHPAAKLGKGILIDHGTGVVIGDTAIVGDNVSLLHKVTLGGLGAKQGPRHPIVGNGVLLGAGATLLGPIKIGDGANIGASSMVIEDVPAHAIAVGVPARIIMPRSGKSATASPFPIDQVKEKLGYNSLSSGVKLADTSHRTGNEYNLLESLNDSTTHLNSHIGVNLNASQQSDSIKVSTNNNKITSKPGLDMDTTTLFLDDLMFYEI